LLQALEKACSGCGASGPRLTVETGLAQGEVLVRIGGSCDSDGSRCPVPSGEPRLESARGRMDAMGGRLAVDGPTVELHLALAAAPSA
jgi:hypothetical protein